MTSLSSPRLLLLSALLVLGGCAGLRTVPTAEPPPDVPPVAREFRAAWIATVANIDWPSEPGLPVGRQQEELRALLDRAAELNLNAVILQVRPAADALYNSLLEPWSEYLTGAMGRAPEPYYDPLAFAVEEAHARGLELHAWFNPYRALHPSAASPVSDDHVSRTQPEIVRRYGDHLWLDPGEPAAHRHTLDVILDVVERYDVDGIHFDDYFYPYRAYADGAEFPDSASWARAEAVGMSRADWRRRNVDRLIEDVYTAVKARKPHVKFGISPFGIWRPGHPPGITGFDAYDELYADARRWLREGWVDYFTPQIYYRIVQHAQPYPIMLRWWIEQNVHGRHIWPGLFTSRAAGGSPSWPVDEIAGQIYVARAQPGATGAVHFSMRALMTDTLAGVFARELYTAPALVPRSPWIDDEPPERPRLALRVEREGVVLEPSAAPDPDVHLWVLQTQAGAESPRAGDAAQRAENAPSRAGDASPPNALWRTRILPAVPEPLRTGGIPATAVVRSVDRAGNDSPPVVLLGPQAELLRPAIVLHAEWEAEPPVGVEADGVRRNLAPGDSIRVKGVTIRLLEMHAGQPDSVRLALSTSHRTLARWAAEGSAFTWEAIRVAVPAVRASPDELGGGLVELEAARAASLRASIAESDSAGGAAWRMRVPHAIDRLTLHHSGSAEPLRPDDDPAEVLRGLQTWGKEARNWWDVPYHFLIDLDGRIYEGRDPRYAGETNTTYDPAGHLLVSVLGNYNIQEPTPAQVDAIADLMAWAAARYDVPPSEIYGHSDWADTSCPGTHLQALLDSGALVDAVLARLRAAVPNR